MKQRTRSILSELLNNEEENLDSKLESRFSHIFESSMNFMKSINNNKDLTEEQKEDLRKRFVLAIKNGDSSKFLRGIKSLRN